MGLSACWMWSIGCGNGGLALTRPCAASVAVPIRSQHSIHEIQEALQLLLPCCSNPFSQSRQQQDGKSQRCCLAASSADAMVRRPSETTTIQGRQQRTTAGGSGSESNDRNRPRSNQRIGQGAPLASIRLTDRPGLSQAFAAAAAAPPSPALPAADADPLLLLPQCFRLTPRLFLEAKKRSSVVEARILWWSVQAEVRGIGLLHF